MLVLLGWVLYGPSLLCPFLWDEYGLILDNAAKGAFEWRHLPALRTFGFISRTTVP